MLNPNDLQAILHAYSDFSECILDAVEWSDFGTTLKLRIDYIWLADRNVRPDIERKLLVTLKISGVEKAEFDNHMNDILRANINKLDWGFSEIAKVTVGAVPEASADPSGQCVIAIEVWRESGLWIRVVGGNVELEEAGGPSPQERF